MLTTILLILLALYLAGAALFLSLWEGHIEGGWLNALTAALSWPALLVVLALTWWRD